jgi:hypothetical protein
MDVDNSQRAEIQPYKRFLMGPASNTSPDG